MTDFIKWPHTTMAKERDAHLRLLALLEDEPFESISDGEGKYWYWFHSSRPEAMFVAVHSTDQQWKWTLVVYNDDREDSEWTHEEDVVPTARFWMGKGREAPYHLIRDFEMYKENQNVV